MEKLQYSALWLVFNDFESSYETLLEKVNMPTLHISRIILIAVETFKILHKMSADYLQDLLSYKILSTLSDMTTLKMCQECVPQSMVNLLFATRQLVCGTTSGMIFAKLKILRSSGGWSTRRVALRANDQ